jgi:hypothetical protein
VTSLLPDLLLRGASHQHVSDVMVNGSWVVRNGHSSRLDELAITHALRANLGDQPRGESDSRLPGATRAFYAGWGKGPKARW